MNVYERWKQKVNSESDKVQMNVSIRELCEWMGKFDCTFKDECQTIILLFLFLNQLFILFSAIH